MKPTQPLTHGRPRPKAAAARSNHPQSKMPFPVVGVGASAGGLEAFTRFLRHIPSDTGMAFVFVQHLAPNHESALVALLAKVTRMPVKEAQKGDTVSPNCVYVIPAGKDLTIQNGTLTLHPRTSTSQGSHLPVDLFFRSLAEDQDAKAIGVVLSGNGADGTMGIEEIYNKGGLVMVQEPQSAKFDGMPTSAIATGLANFVLSPEDIADKIRWIGRHPYAKGLPPLSQKKKGGQIKDDNALHRLFGLLRARTGVDFGLYKRSTIDRRILRRMVLQRVEKLPDYVAILTKNPMEIDFLYNDILIKVTRFFRDPKTFQILPKKVFGEMMRTKPADAPIRLWIAGCATGEEVYSLAMCLLEFLGDKAPRPPIQIFGSDISDKALEKARAATYPENISRDVSPERLRRFFTKVNGHYQVNKAVREMCVFAKQNIVRDPPFSKLDLISCRNVLIYMDPFLQKRVFPVFHFSLNPKGWLLLGSAETVGASPDLFSVVDNKHRIFLKNAAIPSRLNFDFPMGTRGDGQLEGSPQTSSDMHHGRSDTQKELDRALVSRYAPAGVIVNDKLEVVQFRGDTSPYVRNPSGEPSLKFLKMARDGLQSEIDAALKNARKTNAPVRKSGLHVEYNGERKEVGLEVIPIAIPHSAERYWGIMFEEERLSGQGSTKAARPAEKRRAKPDGDDNRWKKELASTKAYLEAVIEERELAAEELQSTNEEVLSSNEELQSINEEMQTTREELQSTNEELTTVNDELHHANQESLQHINDLNNLLDSVRIPVLMVDNDLKIRRFTSPAIPLLHLIPSDVGRPIGDINTRIKIPNFEKMLMEVIDHVAVKEQQVQDGDGRWYSMRIHPYKTLDKKIDGAIVILIDVESMKRTEMSLTKARDTAEDILATVREPLVVLDAKLQVKRANPSFYKEFQLTPAETEGQYFYDLGDGLWNIPNLRALLEQIIPKNNAFRNFEVVHEFPGIGQKSMILNAAKIFHREGEELILLAIEDITQRKRATLALAEKAKDLARSNKDLEDFAHVVSHDLQSPLNKINAFGDLLKQEIKSTLTKKSADYLNQIQNGAQRMSHLITGILAYSKITSSGHQLESVDMATVVKDALRDLEGQMKAADAKVTATGLPTVMAHPLQMHQLITNLLSNAIKYRGHAAPLIGVSAQREGDFWAFSVRDNGIGIQATHTGQIFDVFHRIQMTDEPGTGLGLSICKKIIEGHGGRIWVASVPGTGSTFTFTLPVT